MEQTTYMQFSAERERIIALRASVPSSLCRMPFLAITHSYEEG